MTEEAIRDLLLDDTALGLIVSDRIVTFSETGRNGIGRIATPDLYVDGFLAPCVLVKDRTLSVLGQIRDTGANMTSARGFIEIWLYNDGDSGYADITAAKEVIYGLLNGVFVEGAGILRWQIDMDGMHDSSLNNAAMVRSDYMITKVRG